MGKIVLMLHVANVACCNSHGGGALSVFPKKRYNCRRGALNNLNCRKPQKRSLKPIAGLRQIMYLCTCNVTKNTTTN